MSVHVKNLRGTLATILLIAGFVRSVSMQGPGNAVQNDGDFSTIERVGNGVFQPVQRDLSEINNEAKVMHKRLFTYPYIQPAAPSLIIRKACPFGTQKAPSTTTMSSDVVGATVAVSTITEDSAVPPEDSFTAQENADPKSKF